MPNERLGINTMFSHGKIFHHLDHLDKWKHGRPWPVMVSLSLTNACDHDCPGCNGGRNANASSLTHEQALNILQQFWYGGTKAVTFAGGGEPLCHPQLVPILKWCNNLNLKCGLITNGSLIDVERAVELRSTCEWIRISVDAGTQSVYEAKHGTSRSLDLVFRNIGYLMNSNGSAVVGATYRFRPGDEDDVEIAAKKLRDSGVSYLCLKHYDGEPNLDSNLVASLKAKYETADFSVLYNRIDTSRHYGICHAMNFVAEIAADGEWYPCCVYKSQGRYSMGNVLRCNVADIVESEAYAEAAQRSVAECPMRCRNHELNNTLEVCFDREPIHKEFV